MKMKKQNKLLIGLVAAFAILVLTMMPVTRAAETVTTTAHFNVPSVVAFQVTLPGESAVESAPGGTATTDIEFNCTDSGGTQSNVEARVVGGSTQADGTPIYSIDNVGTVDLNITIAIDSAMPTCMTLQGGTAYASITTTIGTAATTIVDDFTPSASAQDYYLQNDFSSCVASDSTTRTITISGDQS